MENTAVADSLIDLAKAGDAHAFRELTEPHRRELHVHCYRMLGSYQDAEDALQDTLLNAWQGIGTFEGRASLRTWLYRIATNRCLNLRRAESRRPPKEWNVPGVTPPEPSGLGEVVWLQPFPDETPEGTVERTENISLAFVTALQLLPPRQVAVLVLRDVLGFPAAEVAEMLDTSLDSVNSALKRARSRLPAQESTVPMSDALVDDFVRAYEAGDIDAVVAMLTDDVFMSMPPMPFEYAGREPVAGFFASIFGGRRFDLVQTSANGQLAFGTYLHGPDGLSHGVGLIVLDVRADGISALIRFESVVLPWFGLPRTLPTRANG